MRDTQKNRDSWFERLAAPHVADGDSDGSAPAAMDAADAATTAEVAPSAPPAPPASTFESPAKPVEIAAVPPDQAAPPATVTTPMTMSGPPAPTAAQAAGLSGERPQVPVRKQHLEELKHRWLITQAQLLDDPRQAVEDAGGLIDDAMHLVAMTFTEQRERIEEEWRDNANLNTDALRAVMQRYRKLFQYVLAACQLPASNGGET